MTTCVVPWSPVRDCPVENVMVIGNWPWTWSGRCLLALVVVGGLMAATASQAEARGRGRILQRLRPQATHRTVCANGVCQQVPVAASAVVPEKSIAAAPPAPPEGATKVAPPAP